MKLWERFQFWMGWTDASKLQRKLRPRLAEELERTRPQRKHRVAQGQVANAPPPLDTSEWIR